MHRGARRAAAETPNVKRPLAAPSRPLAVPAVLALALATTDIGATLIYLAVATAILLGGSPPADPAAQPSDAPASSVTATS